MRRVGNLFDRVADMENLRLAFLSASRGKRARDDQRRFQSGLDGELRRLRDGLLDGTYPVGNYRRFTVHDPKEREICAAAFGERVLHHALMNVCGPHFDRWLTGRTFACRRGHGQLKAIGAAQANARRHGWFLKCDFRKYFDSIPHDGLRALLARKFKDGRVLHWFGRIIDTYETSPGRGLPIGNLTSQHFANLYLDRLDRLLPSVPYVRYMDDFVFWGDDRRALLDVRSRVEDFAGGVLGLELKGEPFVNRTALGMDFLGARVFPKTVRASRRSADRYRRKMRLCDWMFARGRLSESEYQGRVTALTSFVAHFDSVGLRRRVLGVRREASGSNRVQRGGSWNDAADNCASSNRNNDNPSNRNNNNGFRLACPAAPQEHATVPADVLFPSSGRDECAQCSPPPVGGAEGRGLPFSIFGETHCGRPERPRAGGDRCE